MSHGERHEELLRSLAAGEIDPDDPRALEFLGACARCRETWSGVSAARAALVREDESRRAILQAADRIELPDVEDRVERALRAEIAATSRRGMTPPAPRARIAWLRPALAAAGILLAVGALVLVLREQGVHETEPDIVLGDEVTILRPVGTVASYEALEFVWEAELTPGGWYSLRLEGRDGEGAPWTPLPGVPGKLREAGWKPEAQHASRWPDHVRWRVSLHDVNGRVLADAPWAELSRSP